MRICVAMLAVVVASCGLSSIGGLARADELPTCKVSEQLQRFIEAGVVRFRCVGRPPNPSVSKQFRDFIRGNQFRRAGRTYSFCLGRKLRVDGREGTYTVSGAKRQRLADGRVTIRAALHLSVNGKRSTITGVLAKRGLKLNGKLYGFAGPPDAFC